MKAPLSWLADFAPIEADVERLTDTLNQIGLIVEGVAEPGREVRGVVVAKVVDVVRHPNAERLTLVDIDAGGEQRRVVCGASNFAPGDVVPWAPPGARLPGGMTLERRRIRGEVSDGMLCSGRELGITDDHSGILILPVDTPLGADAGAVLGLDDVIFDLEITPNRPDAMSIVGVARDLAAALGVPCTVPDPPAPPGRPAEAAATLVVEAPEGCPRYVARAGRVTMGTSPAWMAQRLTKAGMRPISNVVDVTNYVLLERGQPLHAFDLALLGGRGIVVRTASAGEVITTLDGVERALSTADLLICDADGVPQAIAGIMGGGSSEVSATTTEVLVESAYFAPEGILHTSKRLGLRTESSARFERGVDPNGVAAAAERAWELLGQVAAGAPVAGALDAYPDPVGPRGVPIRAGRANDILGTELDAERIRGYLEPLGLAAVEEYDDGATYAVPTWRPDLEREIDLIEEVARHHGYNNIARTLPTRAEPGGGLTAAQRRRRLTREVLVGAGLDEAATFSLLSATDLASAGLPGVGIELENPLRAEESLLRTSLLPGLLRAVAFNANQGLPDLALFEIGHVFLPPPDGQVLPDEREHLGIVLAGSRRRRPHEADRMVDGHDVVGALDVVVGALGLDDRVELTPAEGPGLARSRAAAISFAGEEIGTVGEVAASVLDRFGLVGPVVAAELRLDVITAATAAGRRFAAPSRYPASAVDLAFVLDDAVPAAVATATVREAAGTLLEDLRLFDVFSSDALGPGRRSLAFGLRFRAPDRTLTDAEVGDLRRAVVEAMGRAYGATLRG